MTTKLDLPADVVDAHLAGLAASFRAGSVNALFMAIGFCGNQQIAMPEWVVAGYFKGMNRWWLYRCKTLDEAFGVQWPKGKSFEAAKKRYYLEDTILREVKEAARKGESLTPELFAKIGKQHGIGKTLAWDYYTGARQKLQDLKLPGVELLLEPYMTRAARVKRATRKISKLSGSGSKRKTR